MSKSEIDDAAWEKGYRVLQKFRKRRGHCEVPRHQLEGKYRLGDWVSVQRYDYKKNVISPARKARLDQIDFIWSVRGAWWERGFVALKAFKAREGHCLVPIKHVEHGINLGYWVSTQRRNQHRKLRMDNARRTRLNKLGFLWQAND